MAEERVKEIIASSAPSTETLALLERLAAYWEERAVVHEEVAERWPDTKSGREQRAIDGGIAGGYRGVAHDIKEAIASISPTR